MKEKPSKTEKIKEFLTKTIRFITYDIWRISDNEVSGPKAFYIKTLKTIVLAIRNFTNQNLSSRASALTYNTLLAIVPLLAVLLAIAKGFGFQDAVAGALITYLPGHEETFTKGLAFVDNYLTQARGGIFLGVGLLLLFYTVINLIASVEGAFNDIWQVIKPRSWKRKLTDYMALFIILPILMILSSGISIFLSTINSLFSDNFFLSPILNTILKILPFVFTTFVFAGLYILLPNIKVKFVNGLVCGVVVSIAFQVFQLIYISGQIWVSKYNAIYGSFAALPLLMLWLQLSWMICLFGASMTYASQNVKKFSFERDSKNISQRYKDFLILLITTLIIRRFEKGEKPYTADELSDLYSIPIRITTEILYFLVEINILAEVHFDDDDEIDYYQPAIDINKISISYLFKTIDEYGSENFKIDINGKFKKEWSELLSLRKNMWKETDNILLKDI